MENGTSSSPIPRCCSQSTGDCDRVLLSPAGSSQNGAENNFGALCSIKPKSVPLPDRLSQFNIQDDLVRRYLTGPGIQNGMGSAHVQIYIPSQKRQCDDFSRDRGHVYSETEEELRRRFLNSPSPPVNLSEATAHTSTVTKQVVREFGLTDEKGNPIGHPTYSVSDNVFRNNTVDTIMPTGTAPLMTCSSPNYLLPSTSFNNSCAPQYSAGPNLFCGPFSVPPPAIPPQAFPASVIPSPPPGYAPPSTTPLNTTPPNNYQQQWIVQQNHTNNGCSSSVAGGDSVPRNHYAPRSTCSIEPTPHVPMDAGDNSRSGTGSLAPVLSQQHQFFAAGDMAATHQIFSISKSRPPVSNSHQFTTPYSNGPSTSGFSKPGPMIVPKYESVPSAPVPPQPSASDSLTRPSSQPVDEAWMAQCKKSNFVDCHCRLDLVFEQYWSARPGTVPSYGLNVLKSSYPATWYPQYNSCVTSFSVSDVSFQNSPVFTKILFDDDIFGSIGCHPFDVDNYEADTEAIICSKALHPKIVALGEMGLDYSRMRENDNKETQKTIFERQLMLATREIMKPIVLHCRQAEEECYAILKRILPHDYLLYWHNFDETVDIMDKWRGHFTNLYFGVASDILQPETKTRLHDFYTKCPLNRLLIESDAPNYLPDRFSNDAAGLKFNHPGLGVLGAVELAQLRNVPVGEMLQKLYDNAKRLYILESGI